MDNELVLQMLMAWCANSRESASDNTQYTSMIPVINELTHHPLDKMAATSQTTYSNAFFLMKIFQFQK